MRPSACVPSACRCGGDRRICADEIRRSADPVRGPPCQGESADDRPREGGPMPSTTSEACHAVTCPSCGHAAAGAAAPVRRVVAVLFIDIVGFTALVDGLDPEDVYAVQRDYFAVAAGIVRGFGGIV